MILPLPLFSLTSHLLRVNSLFISYARVQGKGPPIVYKFMFLQYWKCVPSFEVHFHFNVVNVSRVTNLTLFKAMLKWCLTYTISFILSWILDLVKHYVNNIIFIWDSRFKLNIFYCLSYVILFSSYFFLMANATTFTPCRRNEDGDNASSLSWKPCELDWWKRKYAISIHPWGKPRDAHLSIMIKRGMNPTIKST